MFEEASKRYSIAMEQQFNYACIYAYIKLKEQEIKNVAYLADIIKINDPNTEKLKKAYILPFNY